MFREFLLIDFQGYFLTYNMKSIVGVLNVLFLAGRNKEIDVKLKRILAIVYFLFKYVVLLPHVGKCIMCQ